ncbi:MAG TPA: SAM-dependent methyltransferase [Rhizobium sp.]|nr:SAM-dependent methyltransferase [Rhizobium sp.]
MAFYDENAVTYAARQRQAPIERLKAFANVLPLGSAILELGCGAGADSAWFIERGFAVTPTDGSAAMAHQAEARLGRPVRVMRFSDLDDLTAYDGVWANACLLHVPRAELPDVLLRIRRALRNNGLFYASFKAGVEEGADRFGRYYNRPSPEWLTESYRLAGFATPRIETASGGGYDGEPTDWLHIWACS